MCIRDHSATKRDGVLEIFDAEVMIYRWAFTQRSGVVEVKAQCSYYAELRIID